ncbi:hypothetical protein BD780_000913 [Clostridium tetanomorphum]|nr:hypothetical protein [Clostridium tetanomorphum]KAJ49767.1 hypothetical protein CTM_21383 [Clostridium tetanomorphum DSM 665]MBP1864240.1 hypothetical protein [Clostridium tetanomorphum]NRS83688.1 hypothetical protein [Clostridium tetanomorphum]NRZ96880.1 hypothetical protein [Clostridium tetanomorphum]SQC02096.1 Uncharacterised protein [Clostridium tetanomorphum]
MIIINNIIIPMIGVGKYKLNSCIKEYYNDIKKYSIEKDMLLIGEFIIRYNINNKLYLFFNINNGKLFKISILNNDIGQMENGICIGMHINEVLRIEPQLTYDDFEEIYSMKGVAIETNPCNDTVECITIYIEYNEDLQDECEKFEKGEW